MVNWFASHPAERIDGEVFSDRFVEVLRPEGKPPPLDPAAVHPPELREIAAGLRVGIDTISVDQPLPFFPERLPEDDADTRPRMLARLLAEAATMQNAATFLAESDDWDFLAVYLDTIDHACHGFIEYHPPAMAHVSAEDAATYGYVVRRVYRFHDMMLARLLAAIGPETTVLLVSDHGFYSDHLRPAVAKHTRNPLEKFGADMNPVAWHAQQGVFVAAGPGIKADELIHGTTLLDMAPTVLALLGLPVADDMDGRALTQIFVEPAAPARIASYESAHGRTGATASGATCRPRRATPLRLGRPWNNLPRSATSRCLTPTIRARKRPTPSRSGAKTSRRFTSPPAAGRRRSPPCAS